MSEHPRITDDELAQFLDRGMAEADRAALEARIAADPDARRRLAQMKEVDDSVRRQFAPTDVSTKTVESWLPDVNPLESSVEVPAVVESGRYRQVVLLALSLAASVAIFLYFTRPTNPNTQPFFQARALAEIYTETVEDGFRPYYFCEDLDRFAATFEKRQGVRLTLADLPADRRMVGLSYVGGMTRDTTAMLCRVEEQPVMVFVDQDSSQRNAELLTESGSGLFVHQSQLGDLVLFEVSPFERAKMMEFLEIPPPQ